MNLISTVNIEYDGTDLVCNLNIQQSSVEHILAIARAFSLIQNEMLLANGPETLIEHYPVGADFEPDPTNDHIL